MILKFIWKIRVKNHVGGFILPYFKIYYKATTIKIVWSRRKDVDE